MKRLILLLLLCFTAPATVSAETVTITGPSGVFSSNSFTSGRIRVWNPTGAATVAIGNNGMATSAVQSGPTISGNPAGNLGVPANGYLDLPFNLGVNSASKPPGTYTQGFTPTGMNVWRGNYVQLHTVTSSFTVTIILSPGAAWSMSPPDFRFGEVYFSNPAPFGKITVNADANAAGNRFWRTKTAAGVESSLTALTLTLGANLVVNTTTPATWTAGSWYQVIQMVGSTPTVIGETAIIKDGQGNFDLSIAATGLPVSGVVTVTGQLGLSGLGQIITAGGLTPYAFTFDGTATTRATQTWTPASQIAEGAAVTVQYRETASDEWQTVGSGTINKAPDGSFAESITASGEGDPEAPPLDAATFILDVVSFESSAKVVQLEIDGQTFTPSGSGVGGDPINGVKQTLQISLPGDPAQYAGKPYRWKVSGTLGGLAVNGMTLTDGTAPQIYFSDFESGFIASNQATIGNPVNDPGEVPDNPFDPEAPPADAAAQAMQDNYRSTRKAMEDALNPGSPLAPGDGPGDGEARAVNKALNTAGAGLASGVASSAGAVAGPGPAEFAAVSSSININLPVFGTRSIDLAGMDPWPGLIRALLLAWLCWLSTIAGIRIFRSAFAG